MRVWVENIGMNCPLESNVLIDVEFGNGDIVSKIRIGLLVWNYPIGHSSRIEKYRIWEDENKLKPKDVIEEITFKIEGSNSGNSLLKPEHTGASVSYYDVTITDWTNPEHQQETPVTVSCNDILEALNMNYACANVFKAIWRICAAKQGKMKKGNNTYYDAEKVNFFAKRVLIQEEINKIQ